MKENSESEREKGRAILISSSIMLPISLCSILIPPIRKTFINVSKKFSNLAFTSANFFYLFSLVSVLSNILFSITATDEIALPKWFTESSSLSEVSTSGAGQGSPLYIVFFVFFLLLVPLYV
jgi:hypothetical protein